ncbi:hypothetical protein [Sphingobium yanoikuyae]|uniref:Uncharacterized protein n=1 Tax=Sphingobium yanoikuyae TaxID=13690 RepID=A0A9X7UAS2_SPHYA|nr:hypothetical protein [Sphingobium yanoikuyae]QNG45824.1 hypothetical protein H3V42_29455 [Sphingobium yanoikuyae]
MGADSILYLCNFIALCDFHISVIKVKSNAERKFHPIRIASCTRKKAMRRKQRGLKKHRLMDWVRRLLLPGASGGR